MNTPSAPGALPDPAQVLRGFANASETTLLLSHTLQLFLTLEKSNVLNPYEEVDEDEVITLIMNPDRLPEHVRSFILWQANILKLDVVEVGKTEVAKGFKTKYDVKGARLAACSSDDERKKLIHVFMEEQEQYFKKFNEVRAILEATEERFVTIEDVLMRAESMDESVCSRIRQEKDALDAIRQKLCDLRALLEDEVLPDIINFEHAPDIAQSFMIELSEINIRLRDNIRKHRAGDED